MNFIEKLDFLLDKNNMNKTDFGKQAVIPYPTIISWYKKGTNQIPRTRLVQVAKFFQVSLDFLCDDEIDISSYEKHMKGKDILNQYRDNIDQETRQTYDALNDSRKMQVHEYIDFLHIQQTNLNNQKEEISAEIFPTLAVQKFIDESNIETIQKVINNIDDLK